MKKDRVLVVATILAFFLFVFAYSMPTYLFIKNKTLNYQKEVYLYGDNIVLDYPFMSKDGAINAITNYATIGTVTYVDLDGNFGALGHEIDNNSNKSGNIFLTPVASVIKSSPNNVGEKNVVLRNWNSSGSIIKVNENGVFGQFDGSTQGKNLISVGMPKDIKKEEALIYTNIGGSKVESYKIEILKIFYGRSHHNIYIKIIDDNLIEKTGGIIQGMSGSPIVQNGKIIGALSHVKINKPEYGYATFITNMM